MTGRRLIALAIAEPSAWAEHVLAALAKHNGNAVHAASSLEVSRRTMARWIRRTPIAAPAAELRQKYHESAQG